MTDAPFVCPRCGKPSWNPHDAEQGYCGACHWWTGDPQLGHIEPPGGDRVNLTYFETVVAQALASAKPSGPVSGDEPEIAAFVHGHLAWEATVDSVVGALAAEREAFDRSAFLAEAGRR